MKKISVLLCFTIFIMVFQGCINGSAESATAKENITFYSVPLVCGADKEIGCGSRAKPALVDMEKNDAIKEAWLNREGTVIAIVWKNEPETEKAAKPVFEKYEIDFTELKGNDAQKNLTAFQQKNLWYRGADVDKLSIEEAEHIAETYTDFSVNKKMITQEEADKIKPEIESYFKAELVKTRTPEQLYEDDENKFRTDVINIFINRIGKERTDQLIEMYKQYEQEQCKKDCSKDKAKKCCKKN